MKVKDYLKQYNKMKTKEPKQSKRLELMKELMEETNTLKNMIDKLEGKEQEQEMVHVGAHESKPIPPWIVCVGSVAIGALFGSLLTDAYHKPVAPKQPSMIENVAIQLAQNGFAPPVMMTQKDGKTFLITINGNAAQMQEIKMNASEPTKPPQTTTNIIHGIDNRTNKNL